MKVILFLAAVYALIFNQSQQKKPPITLSPTANNTQSFTRDTTIKHLPVSTLYRTYMNAQPSALLQVTATPAVMKRY